MMQPAISLVTLALGVIVPAVVLTVRADDAMPPFGWPRVAVVHLLALIPLGLMTMRAVARRRRGPSLWLVGLALLLGLALAWMTAAQRVAFGRWLNANEVGFLARLLVRVHWCLILALPWWLVGGFLLGPIAESSRRTRPLASILLALVVANVCPALYARTMIIAQTTQAEKLMHGRRLVPLSKLTPSLLAIGSDRPIGVLPPRTLHNGVLKELRECNFAVMHPLPKNATDDERRERARQLALLDRLDDADWLLAPMKTDVAAVLFRAVIQQHLKHWQQSDDLYRKGLEMGKALPAHARIANEVRVFDGLAFNAREQGHPEIAEAIYQEALTSTPEAKAHFHFQLGRHYETGGRPTLALDHLRKAVALSPRQFSEPARPLLDKLLTQTPGCVLRPAR